MMRVQSLPLVIITAALLSSFTVPGMSQHAKLNRVPATGTPSPPAQCTTAPRTADELSSLVSQATPLPSFYLGKLPSGQPTDAATVAAVTHTVRERIACRQAGELLRWLALATDGYIRRTVVPGAGTLPPPPSPSPNSRLADLHLVSIQDVIRLDDGRVSAIVTLAGGGEEDENPAPGRTYLMFFAKVDGRWLLDGKYVQVMIGNTVRDVADLVATPAS